MWICNYKKWLKEYLGTRKVRKTRKKNLVNQSCSVKYIHYIYLTEKNTAIITKEESYEMCYSRRLSVRHLSERDGLSGCGCQGRQWGIVLSLGGWAGLPGVLNKKESDIWNYQIFHTTLPNHGLRGERDSSTSQPPVLTAVSRCQLASVCAATSLLSL